jgi:predicted HicB family RNase H-like nuclease
MSDPPRAKGGIPITDEFAEQLADEAEAGYQRTRAKRVGRKSLGGTAGTSPRVNFRMTAELQARAQAIADREGKTVSEIAREALEQYVK